MAEITYPKIALGAWAWGNDGTFGGGIDAIDLEPVFDAAKAAAIELSAKDIAVIEEAAGTLKVDVIRF